MNEVEICCTGADRQRIDWLAHALAERGWSCGFAVERMPERTARCAIVVWTEGSRRARVMKRVAGAARRRGILVSATFDGVQAPGGLGGRAKEDLSAWPAKSADRAIDSLLDDVAFVVANPKAVRERRDTGDTVVVAVVAVLFVGLLYTLVSRERGGGAQQDVPSSAGASRTVPSATTSTSPSDASPPAPAPPPRPVESVAPAEQAAATLGRQAIDALGRVLAGDASSAEEAKRSAYTALRVDPNEPNAQLAHAICIAMLDGAWTDAARTIHGIDPATLSSDAAQLAARWHLLQGDVQQAGNALTHGSLGDRTWEVADIERDLTAPVEPHALPPLCALLDGVDQTAAAAAYRALAPGERLVLLGEPCFISKVAVSQTVRTLLGIGM